MLNPNVFTPWFAFFSTNDTIIKEFLFVIAAYRTAQLPVKGIIANGRKQIFVSFFRHINNPLNVSLTFPK
jgi:hypothetical protein